jgi:hypothetical protein
MRIDDVVFASIAVAAKGTIMSPSCTPKPCSVDLGEYYHLSGNNLSNWLRETRFETFPQTRQQLCVGCHDALLARKVNGCWELGFVQRREPGAPEIPGASLKVNASVIPYFLWFVGGRIAKPQKEEWDETLSLLAKVYAESGVLPAEIQRCSYLGTGRTVFPRSQTIRMADGKLVKVEQEGAVYTINNTYLLELQSQWLGAANDQTVSPVIWINEWEYDTCRRTHFSHYFRAYADQAWKLLRD